MTINQAKDYFQNATNRASRKADAKLFNKFLQILESLENRTFSDRHAFALEKLLDTFDLSKVAEVNMKQKKEEYETLIAFLKQELNLTTSSYYTEYFMNYGMLVGPALGLVIGLVINPNFGIALGLCIGTAIGLIGGFTVGGIKDAQAKKSGQVLS